MQLFEKVSEQLKKLRDDFGALAKSKPDAPLNVQLVLSQYLSCLEG